MRFQNIRNELQIEEDYLLTTYNTKMNKDIRLAEINDNILEKPGIRPTDDHVKKGVKR